MRPSLSKPSLALLPLLLAACSTSGGDAGGPTPAPIGSVVAEAVMPEFCQNAAAGKYGAQPQNIETESPVLRDFGFLVTGSADNGMRTYLFNCRFDPTGKFLGLEAT